MNTKVPMHCVVIVFLVLAGCGAKQEEKRIGDVNAVATSYLYFLSVGDDKLLAVHSIDNHDERFGAWIRLLESDLAQIREMKSNLASVQVSERIAKEHEVLMDMLDLEITFNEKTVVIMKEYLGSHDKAKLQPATAISNEYHTNLKRLLKRFESLRKARIRDDD